MNGKRLKWKIDLRNKDIRIWAHSRYGYTSYNTINSPDYLLENRLANKLTFTKEIK